MVKKCIALFTLACSCLFTLGQAYTLADPAFLFRAGQFPQVITNQLSGDWKFNEGSGQTVINYGVLSVVNAQLGPGYSTNWVRRGTGWAASMQDAYGVNCGSDSLFNLGLTNSWSLSMWICHTGATFQTEYLWLMRSPPNNTEGYGIIGTSGDVSLNLRYPNGIQSRVNTNWSSYFTANTWRLLTFSRSSATNYSLYLDDGAVRISRTNTVSTPQNSSPVNLFLGGGYQSGIGTANRWQGYIGETLFYSGYALTTNDLHYLYHTYYGIP